MGIHINGGGLYGNKRALARSLRREAAPKSNTANPPVPQFQPSERTVFSQRLEQLDQAEALDGNATRSFAKAGLAFVGIVAGAVLGGPAGVAMGVGCLAVGSLDLFDGVKANQQSTEITESLLGQSLDTWSPAESDQPALPMTEIYQAGQQVQSPTATLATFEPQSAGAFTF